MSADLIVSYDGTSNDEDALALGGLLARLRGHAGARLRPPLPRMTRPASGSPSTTPSACSSRARSGSATPTSIATSSSRLDRRGLEKLAGARAPSDRVRLRVPDLAGSRRAGHLGPAAARRGPDGDRRGGGRAAGAGASRRSRDRRRADRPGTTRPPQTATKRWPRRSDAAIVASRLRRRRRPDRRRLPDRRGARAHQLERQRPRGAQTRCAAPCSSCPAAVPVRRLLGDGSGRTHARRGQLSRNRTRVGTRGRRAALRTLRVVDPPSGTLADACRAHCGFARAISGSSDRCSGWSWRPGRLRSPWSARASSGNGCVHVTSPAGRAATELNQCGAGARALCALLRRPAGPTPPCGATIAAECRKAGLPLPA